MLLVQRETAIYKDELGYIHCLISFNSLDFLKQLFLQLNMKYLTINTNVHYKATLLYQPALGLILCFVSSIFSIKVVKCFDFRLQNQAV